MTEKQRPIKYKKYNVLLQTGLLSEEKFAEYLLCFPPQKKESLITTVIQRVHDKSVGLAPLILVEQDKLSGLEHLTISDEKGLQCFLQNVDNYYKTCQEIWLTTSGCKDEKYFGRLKFDYKYNTDILEVARGKTPRVLNFKNNAISFQRFDRQFLKSFRLIESNKTDADLEASSAHIRSRLASYKKKFDDLELVLTSSGISSIALQFALENDGTMSFNDWDGDYKKILTAFDKFKAAENEVTI